METCVKKNNKLKIHPIKKQKMQQVVVVDIKILLFLISQAVENITQLTMKMSTSFHSNPEVSSSSAIDVLANESKAIQVRVKVQCLSTLQNVFEYFKDNVIITITTPC